jgi:cell division protein FtsI/penicillin-binding protein 2
MVTQIQLAAAYAALVNGGYYIKPTIITKIVSKTKNGAKLVDDVVKYNEKKKIFKDSTSEQIKQALSDVLNQNTELSSANIKEVKLGAKS